MKNRDGYMITNDSIQLFVNGQSKTLARSAPQADRVIGLIKQRKLKAAIKAADLQAAKLLRSRKHGDLKIEADAVYVRLPKSDGWERLAPVLEQKMLAILKQGLPLDSLVAFVRRLWANPSMRVREQLYQFLGNVGMPITTKGTFLAYKGIREDGKDVHSGTIDNSPGQTPTMPRRLVNDDPNQGCSQGLHVGAFEYASHWGPRVVLVEVDPADVVSVPADHSYQKCRACKYKVLRDSEGLLQDGVASVLEPYKLAPGAKASLAQDLADLLCVVHVTE